MICVEVTTPQSSCPLFQCNSARHLQDGLSTWLTGMLKHLLSPFGFLTLVVLRYCWSHQATCAPSNYISSTGQSTISLILKNLMPRSVASYNNGRKNAVNGTFQSSENVPCLHRFGQRWDSWVQVTAGVSGNSLNDTIYFDPTAIAVHFAGHYIRAFAAKHSHLVFHILKQLVEQKHLSFNASFSEWDFLNALAFCCDTAPGQGSNQISTISLTSSTISRERAGSYHIGEET